MTQTQTKTSRSFKTWALLAGLATLSLGTQAQTKFGGTPGFADSSAYLQLGDATGGNKGFLMPRVSLTSTTTWGLAGTTPVEGMQVYNTNVSITGANAQGTGLYYWTGGQWKSGGDNLGNHTATKALNMTSHNIDSIRMASIFYETRMYDRIAANTNYMSWYKNGGKLSLWNNSSSSNPISVDETTNATTLQSAAITKGTDGVAPQAGYVATSADANGNIVWAKATAMPGAVQGVWEFLGTTPVSISKSGSAGGAVSIPMSATSFTLTKPALVLITYSALPTIDQSAYGGPSVAQGSIDLIVDGGKVISSYFSSVAVMTTAYSWYGLGNYSTAQKLVSLPAGTHTVAIASKVWSGDSPTGGTSNVSVTYNTNVSAYIGEPSDPDAGKTRISIIAFN